MAKELHINDTVRVDDADSNDNGKVGKIHSITPNGTGGTRIGVVFPDSVAIRYFGFDALTPVDPAPPAEPDTDTTAPPAVTLHTYEDGTGTLTVEGSASYLAGLAVAIIGGTVAVA